MSHVWINCTCKSVLQSYAQRLAIDLVVIVIIVVCKEVSFVVAPKLAISKVAAFVNRMPLIVPRNFWLRILKIKRIQLMAIKLKKRNPRGKSEKQIFSFNFQK